eukprot:SAG31_NODE_25485_length_460_cov_0.997230_2_plen_20_part_01
MYLFVVGEHEMQGTGYNVSP